MGIFEDLTDRSNGDEVDASWWNSIIVALRTALPDFSALSGDFVGTTDTQDISNKTFTDEITMQELGSTPSTPASGDQKLYFKDDGELYALDDGGNETLITQTGASPAGAISAYGGATAPTGWLLCDGTAVSRATYSALYAVVGDAFGEGDGSTTFNVPDFRGRFLRGFDDGQGRDPDAGSRTAMNTGGNTGDNIGSIQDDEIAAHSHTLPTSYALDGGTFYKAGQTIPVQGQSSGSFGGNETRPINANVNYIIKF